MFRRVAHTTVLFWMGLIGLVFYAVRPVLFPEVPNTPEVLPVYTLMMGISQAAKKRPKNEEPPPEEENDV